MTSDRLGHLTLHRVVVVLLVLTSILCVLMWARGLDQASTVRPGPVPVGQTSALLPAGGVEASSARPAQPDRGDVGRGRSSAAPAVLAIPSINVRTPVIDLGLQPDGTVEVPGDPELAGWFEPGTAPGEVGSSVILGHVDSQTGPAVFYRLEELTAGDVIWVGRDDGTAVRFVVRRVRTYVHDEFPARRLYAAPHHRRVLNLVTCGGVYDSARGGYQANVVVFARRARSDH